MATKELLEARHSTPLEIEFENSMTGGMKQVKERIRLANEAVQTKTKQAEEMEAETERLKTGKTIIDIGRFDYLLWLEIKFLIG